MRLTTWLASGACLVSWLPATAAYKQYSAFSSPQVLQSPFSIYGDRPDNCPPCFNCNLDNFQCLQFANCTKSTGRCACPSGFGGEDCSQPLCGSLADGNNRLPRQGDECQCRDGWEGINCNVCNTDSACEALVEEGEEAVCAKDGRLVKENYQMCDIVNRKILDQLKEQKPQASFSCNAERAECNFQCMFVPIISSPVHVLTKSCSLGRQEGIFLLRARPLPALCEYRGHPKHYQLRV